MKPWILLGAAGIPGSTGELRLYQRDAEHAIRILGVSGDLMNSRLHGSEDALGELACVRLAGRPAPRLLIGGLGMGFTLAAALKGLASDAEVIVAELIPAVVEWNRGPLGIHAGHPLQDPRVTVREEDVAGIIQREANAFDAILLDVDNGPEGLTREENNWLYSNAGLSACFRALRPEGILAVWSAGPKPVFTERLRQQGFAVEEQQVRAHRGRKGARHNIWLARRGA
ncbi:hypothetical protein [Thermithiobacillus plumbiphilus]|uniref:Spermidine synthase n=1 Tax=Thermithiobacillus plumbiphilus TaxID=1729899 RepID=A0ABU9D6K5_9PROT